MLEPGRFHSIVYNWNPISIFADDMIKCERRREGRAAVNTHYSQCTVWSPVLLPCQVLRFSLHLCRVRNLLIKLFENFKKVEL